MMTIFQPFANTLWNSLKDTEITKVPKTDLRDTGDSYVLEADMPGFRKEEIKLSLEGDVLTIAAEHTAEKQNEEAPEKDGASDRKQGHLFTAGTQLLQVFAAAGHQQCRCGSH